MFVRPVFGKEDGTGNYWCIGDAMSTGMAPSAGSLLLYSTAVVAPPEIPGQLDGDEMKVWELYRVETEVLIAAKTHSTGYVPTTKNYGGVEGAQYYFWAVGGEPLDVLGIKPRYDVVYPEGVKGPPDRSDVIGPTTVRAKVDGPKYPVECWLPDPSRNENCRYYGRMLGGNSTPPVITLGNTSTIPVLDENGIGVLLLSGKLYITSADMVGGVANDEQPTLAPNTHWRRVHAASGRFFRFHFRQRKVKNPYTMDLLYKQVFGQQQDTFVGQTGVAEVTMTEDPGIPPPTVEGAVGVPTVTSNVNRQGVLLNTPQPLLNTKLL